MQERKFVKYIVLGLVVLLIGAVITNTISSKTIKPENQNNLMIGRSWSDNFDTYTTGQFLDGEPEDGGWKGWDNDPQFGAYVVDNQSISSPNSVEVVGNTDLIREYTGYTSGQWTYIAWVFVPDDFIGNSYFMLLSYYEDFQGANNKWQFVVRFDSANQIVESENDLNSLPLITDMWVEIRVEIDLDSDWFEIYYDNDLLVEREWTAGWNGAGDGYLVIDAVDLFASSSTEIYYDDMSLTGEILIPALCCDGNLNWENVTAGGTVTGEFQVSNCGDEGSILDWEIAEKPDWGNWTFTPESGTGLTPEDGWITIDVEVVAPEETETEFTGEIKIVNSNNPDDFCEIDVVLKTPFVKSIKFPFLQVIFERFPNAFPILKQLFGL